MVTESEIVSLERLFFDVVDTDKIHFHEYRYIPLYEQLTEYWDKLILTMPERLSKRVQNAAPSWDEIESANPPISREQAIAIRTARIMWFDIKRDPSQEWETYIALQGYIRGGYQIGNYPSGKFIPDQNGYELGILPSKVAELRANSKLDLAELLEKEIIVPLDNILMEHGVHWPDTEPVLWKSLSKFKEMVLPGLIKEFEEHENEEFVYELKLAEVYILRILRLDGSRIGREYPLIEDEWKKNNLANTDFLKQSIESNENANAKSQEERARKVHAAVKQNSNFIYEFMEKYLDGKKRITQLAIPIAWQIECRVGRKPFPKEVIKELQSRVNIEDMLLESFRDGVIWQTKGLKPKSYDEEACSKTLGRWERARVKEELRQTIGH